jgi:3-methylcrotonyl-CoA carboxylase alpha subunit
MRWRHVSTPKTPASTGVREGDAITPYYDPMIAKLIAWGRDRDQALSTMREALQQVRVVGVHTNAQFLLRLVNTPAFAGAQLHTGLIEANEALLQAPAPRPSPAVLALACAAALRWMHGAHGQIGAFEEAASHVSPWSGLAGWRLNGVHTRVLRLHGEHDIHACKITYATPPGARDAARVTIEVDDDTFHARLDAADDAGLIRPSPAAAHLRTVCENGRVHVFADGEHWVFDGWDPLAAGAMAEEDGGHLNAPMPGRIVSLLVQEGQSVSKGAPLLVMEAMKMEHTITAPHDGLIESLPHAEGDQVSEGTALVILKPLAPVPTEAP